MIMIMIMITMIITIIIIIMSCLQCPDADVTSLMQAVTQVVNITHILVVHYHGVLSEIKDRMIMKMIEIFGC